MFTLPVTTLINSPPIILRRSYAQIDILLHDNITDKLFQKHSIKDTAFNKLLTRSKTKHLSTSPKHSKDSTNCFVANKPSREKRKPLKLNNAPTWIFQNRKILANETSGILPRRVVNKPGPKRMITSTNTNIMQISNKIPLLKLHLRRQWHGGIQPTGDDKKNKLLKGLFSNTVIYKKCFSHSSDTRLANLTNCKNFLTKF